jgi:hypothetical protein
LAIVVKGDEVEAVATEGSTRMPVGFCSSALDGSTTSGALQYNTHHYISKSQVEKEKVSEYLNDDNTFFSGIRRGLFYKGLSLVADTTSAAAAWDICWNTSNMRPKIISIATKSRGLWGP